jgi:hypothetical protein
MELFLYRIRGISSDGHADQTSLSALFLGHDTDIIGADMALRREPSTKYCNAKQGDVWQLKPFDL